MNRAELVWLVLIVLFAFALRLWGINWGEPYVYHPDEWEMVWPALRMVQTGDFNPHDFHKPSFLIYAEAAIAKVVNLTTGASLDAERPSGMLPMEAPPAQFPYYLWGRIFVALLGTATVFLVFVAGKTLHGPGTGLAAALLLSPMPLHVTDSHYLAVDVPAAFFAALTLVFAGFSLKTNRAVYFLLSGLTVGLTAATKYNFGIVGVTLLLAFVLTRKRLRDWIDIRLLFMAVGTVVGFLVACPFSVLDYATFVRGLQFQMTYYISGHPGAEGPDNWRWYLTYLYERGLYPFVAITVAAGLVWSLFRRRKADILVLSFVLVYYMFLSSFVVRFERNLMPILPFLALLGGRLVTDVADAIGHHLRRPRLLRSLPVVLLTLLPAHQAFMASVRQDQVFTQKDTRTIALEWVKENVPKGSRIVRETYTPQVTGPEYEVRVWWSLIEPNLEKLKSSTDYLIVSAGMFGRYVRAPDRYPAEAERYQKIFSLPLVMEFRPGEGVSGPIIRLYLRGAGYYRNLLGLLRHYGCRGGDGEVPSQATDEAAISDEELACFFSVRKDVLALYAANGWDTSPANFRSVFEDWWAMTTERDRGS